jgi:Zn-dependent protease with chaperone function
MTLRRGPAMVSLVAAAAAVGLCMVVAPVAGHPAGWLLPAGLAVVVGVAVFSAKIGWHAYRHHRLSQRLRAISRPGVIAEIEIRELAGSPGAFVAGLWRPNIFCSPQLSSDLRPDELRAVLLHERYHQLDWAPAKLVALEALAPALGVARSGRAWLAQRIAALEIAADRHAVEQGSSRGALARALMKLVPMQAGGVGIGFATATDLRLQALIDEQPAQQGDLDLGWVLAPALIAVLCVLLVLPA